MLWDAANRLVMCNIEVPAGQRPVGPRHRAGHAARRRSKASMLAFASERRLANANGPRGGATFERQLADGRWLQVNELRTRDGGTVSVGTDITQLKQHQEKLVDSERRLMATIHDLSLARRAEQERGQRARRPQQEIHARDRARRGGQPRQVRIPRQHVARAEHAAQRHHRLLRSDGVRRCSGRSARSATTNMPATSIRAAATCSASSTTYSTCRRSRPASSRWIARRSSSAR